MYLNQQFRKISAIAVAGSLLAAAPIFPVSAEDTGYIFCDTFEDGVSGWSGRGAASAARSQSEAYTGNGSLFVSGRTAEWNGAAKTLSTSEFRPGTAYSFSANMLYTGSSGTTICLTLQYSDGTGETKYSGIAEVSAPESGWVQIATTSYTIPAGASDLLLYAESKTGTSDFYLDEVIAAPEGTVIEGAKPKLFVRGDLNGDEVLTASDLSLLKGCILNGFSDTSLKKASDINQDRQYTDRDGELLMQFLRGEITEFPVEKAQSGGATTGFDRDSIEKSYHFPSVQQLSANKAIPDPFVFVNGDHVESVDDWVARASEISCQYEYYMYGKWRDGSDDEVTYSISGNKMTIYVKRISTGKSTSFTANLSLPSQVRHDGGAPVIVGMHSGISEGTATANGYAVITIGGMMDNYVAQDNNSHKGPFYELYPYGNTWEEQTGVLMAWSWGCSKVLDALYNGAGAELNINPESSIVTGVSRWGKAAAVCGAFDTRFKMVAPSCSGAGGLALYRYKSEGKTYDFSSKGGNASYTYDQNEPLGSLQATGEQGWFNGRFMEFRNENLFPVDQHMLGALCADPNRYLFIIASCQNENWVNAPSMWMSYLGMRHVWDYLGISDNLAINVHLSGHAVIEEDVKYMCQYFDYHVYGIEPSMDLSNLQTSVFALPKNHDPIWDTFDDNWLY